MDPVKHVRGRVIFKNIIFAAALGVIAIAFNVYAKPVLKESDTNGPQGQQAGWIYWTDIVANTVTRADSNGVSVGVIISTGKGPVGSPARGLPESGPIAIAVGGGKIYWSDFIKQTISSANLDGSKVKTIVRGVRDPFGLALDLSRGKIYWTSQAIGAIRRANLNGTKVEDVLTDLGGRSGAGIVDLDIDIDGGKVYWSDIRTRTIMRANSDGTGLREQVMALPSGSRPQHIAVDPIRKKAYCADYTAMIIYRVDLASKEREVIISFPQEKGYIGAIALDLKKGKIYFHHTVYTFKPFTMTMTIKRANLDGTDLQTVVESAGEVGGLAFQSLL